MKILDVFFVPSGISPNSIFYPLDSFFEKLNIEINEKAGLEITKLEIGKNLGEKNVLNGADAFTFYNDLIFYE